MNAKLLRITRRALLMRLTEPAGDDCRRAKPDALLDDDMPLPPTLSTMEELAWLVQHDEELLVGLRPVPGCGTEGCVMHLELPTEEARDRQFVASYRPPRTLAQIVREGIRRGVFRHSGGYAN